MDAEARLAIFAIMEKNHEVIKMENGGRVESMYRLTHVIPSVLIKNRTVVGASNKIERMPIT